MADAEEPSFPVTSADFAADPFLVRADRYGRPRLLARPTALEAAACGRWLEHQDAVGSRWALGYGFITRDSVESPVELAEAATVLQADPDASAAHCSPPDTTPASCGPTSASTSSAGFSRPHRSAANQEVRRALGGATVRAVELVAVFTAAIAFAVGSLQVMLNGSLGLADRMWLMAAQGLGQLLFALTIVAGTWYLTRDRRS